MIKPTPAALKKISTNKETAAPIGEIEYIFKIGVAAPLNGSGNTFAIVAASPRWDYTHFPIGVATPSGEFGNLFGVGAAAPSGEILKPPLE